MPTYRVASSIGHPGASRKFPYAVPCEVLNQKHSRSMAALLLTSVMQYDYSMMVVGLRVTYGKH